MPTAPSNPTVTITLKDLEKLIRRVVREEMTSLMQHQPSFFFLDPNTPLYEDMAEIAQMKKRGKVEVYSRKEAFGD